MSTDANKAKNNGQQPSEEFQILCGPGTVRVSQGFLKNQGTFGKISKGTREHEPIFFVIIVVIKRTKLKDEEL